ncbi:nucleotidyltransferase domain-containing protein [Umezawaea endophytica]|uniref:Nucleotidyltransferase domain-containing protein n=1 Tax=Umezawaea endophytica TaxID=1654476 RepID=A0A9X2VUL2_9PSEU|nr:nucleotidyltransferase domain-containing protein [Umezawaea endophytica]MCS7481913.1 nucleotidyltransferase domain-containing protein [Umezawaea endophytica]
MTEFAHELKIAIGQLELNSSEQSALLERISKDTQGLLIYGSRARGDHISTSDFDLLQLNKFPFSTFKIDRVSVSSYTPEQLSSATRTLFGTHIIRDGRVIFDPNGELAQIIESLEPADPQTLLETVHHYSIILNQSDKEKRRYLSGLVRLARYLLRTAIYAKAMLSGSPCFSVRELAERFNDPELSTILASDPQVTGKPSKELFEELTSRLIENIGPFPENTYGSISAIAVSAWDSDRNLAALAVRAMSEDKATLNYSDLPKVLL